MFVHSLLKQKTFGPSLNMNPKLLFYFISIYLAVPATENFQYKDGSVQTKEPFSTKKIETFKKIAWSSRRNGDKIKKKDKWSLLYFNNFVINLYLNEDKKSCYHRSFYSNVSF